MGLTPQESHEISPDGVAVGMLWGSSTVSALGTAVTSVALPLVAVFSLRATTFQVSWVMAAGMAAWIVVGPMSGVWADLLPHRRLLVACDLLRAAALVSVPAAAVLGVLSLAQLLAVAFVVSVCSVFFDVAFQSYVPSLVPVKQLLSVNSRLQGSATAAQVGGSSLGGVVVQAIGPPATLLVDTASYLISGMCLLATGKPGAAGAPRIRGESHLAQAQEGARFLWTHPVLRPLALTAASFNMCAGGIMAVQVVFLVRTVHLRPALVGVLLAVDGLAGVLGTLTVGRLTARMGTARAIVLAVIAGPAFALLIPLTSPGLGVLTFAVGAAGLATFTVISSVLTRVYRQTAVPRHLLSRVTAAIRFISWGVLPVGALLAGLLGETIGNRAALWVVTGALVVLAPAPVLLSPVRGVRDILSIPVPGVERKMGGTEPGAVTTGQPAGHE